MQLREKMEPGPREPRTFQNGGRRMTTAERLPVRVLSDHSPAKSQEALDANSCVPTHNHRLQVHAHTPDSAFKLTLKSQRSCRRTKDSQTSICWKSGPVPSVIPVRRLRAEPQNMKPDICFRGGAIPKHFPANAAETPSDANTEVTSTVQPS